MVQGKTGGGVDIHNIGVNAHKDEQFKHIAGATRGYSHIQRGNTLEFEPSTSSNSVYMTIMSVYGFTICKNHEIGRSRNYIIDCHGALLVAKKKKMWIDTTGHDHKLKDVDKSKKNTIAGVTHVETPNVLQKESTTDTDADPTTVATNKPTTDVKQYRHDPLFYGREEIIWKKINNDHSEPKLVEPEDAFTEEGSMLRYCSNDKKIKVCVANGSKVNICCWVVGDKMLNVQGETGDGVDVPEIGDNEHNSEQLQHIAAARRDCSQIQSGKTLEFEPSTSSKCVYMTIISESESIICKNHEIGRSRNYIIDWYGTLLDAKKGKMWIDTLGHDHEIENRFEEIFITLDDHYEDDDDDDDDFKV